MIAQFYVGRAVKESKTATVDLVLDLEKALKFTVGVGVEGLWPVRCCEVVAVGGLVLSGQVVQETGMGTALREC